MKNVSKKSQEISFTQKNHLRKKPQNISQEKIIKKSSDNINTKRITEKELSSKILITKNYNEKLEFTQKKFTKKSL